MTLPPASKGAGAEADEGAGRGKGTIRGCERERDYGEGAWSTVHRLHLAYLRARRAEGSRGRMACTVRTAAHRLS